MNEPTRQPYAVLLVPAPLSQIQPAVAVFQNDLTRIHNTRTWFVETAKTARAFLKIYGHPVALSDLYLMEINTLLNAQSLEETLLKSIACGDIGVISDAGCPGIADPGSEVVKIAHQHKITVKPLIGPSSLVLALMASGMNGQAFSFHGYLPIPEQERSTIILHTERDSSNTGRTHIVIETPYRNNQLLKSLINTLQIDTRLCIASDLTGPQEKIISQPIVWWRRHGIELEKVATVFLWTAALETKSISANPSAAGKRYLSRPGRK